MTMNSADPFSELAARASAPSERVLASLQQEMKGNEPPKRSLSRVARVGWSAVSLGLGLCLTSFNAFFRSPRELVLTLAAVCLSTSGLLLAGAVPNGRARLGGVSGRRLLMALLLIVGFTALALRAEEFLPWSHFMQEDSLYRVTKCASHALLSGVVGASALVFVWRRTDPFSPGLTGAVLGLIGGAVGTTSVNLLCEHQEGLHLTFGHGISLIAVTVLGIFLGRKWLSP